MTEQKHFVKLAGSGSFFPGEAIPFEGINDYLGNFDHAPKKLQSWTKRIQPIMKEMLGIEHCYYAFDSATRTFKEDNLTMSVKSARLALEDANMSATDIDLIVYGGAYSYQIPPVSSRIQQELGIDICGEFHVHSNCTSVYKAVKIAHNLLKSGEYKNALVISSSVASSCFVPEFYNQEKLVKEDIFLRWYLCDGAGAFVLSVDDERSTGYYLEDSYVESAGGHKRSAMFNQLPYHWISPQEEYDKALHHITQIYLNDMKDHACDANGKTIFYNALVRMAQKHNIDLKMLKKLVINMPSKSVRQYIKDECEELGIAQENFYSIVETRGYSGPPAALISMHELLKNETFNHGDLIMSFVMEVSKFMQAGFTLRYLEEDK